MGYHLQGDRDGALSVKDGVRIKPSSYAYSFTHSLVHWVHCYGSIPGSFGTRCHVGLAELRIES